MNRKVHVIICAVCIVVLFCVSVFLMTTVDPDPMFLPPYDNNDTIERRNLEDNFGFEDIPPRAEFQNPGFGLNKMLPSSVDPLPNLFRTGLDKSLEGKVYPPPLISLASQLDINHTTSMNAETITFAQNNNTFEELRNPVDNNTIDKARVEKTIIFNAPPIKGQRRSANTIQKIYDAETGSIFLKILNDRGKSRIEIKVSPDNDNSEQLLRAHRSSMSIVSEIDESKELPERTEIKILPNATVVISDLSEVLDSKITNDSITLKNNEVITRVDGHINADGEYHTTTKVMKKETQVSPLNTTLLVNTEPILNVKLENKNDYL